ncbi:transcription termination factor 4, mitochondrial isoform X11 [Pan troglodytes]|uniref:transcription termination factor 4, mitochondrial isoform X11 n=1 Tax=Pan troglodytes TaxID=9598 RepID=UPI0023EFFFD5|nr:transcription termination factor 4, mitochondrial isoform X3 [Pan troglodytes]
MAAFSRQVLDWHRLIPLTWACMARQTLHLGEQRRTTASLLRKLTTASNGGVTEELSCVRSNNYVQEPECRRNLVQCLLEKQGTPVEQGSLELERVMSSLQDMGFSNAHINELLSVRRDASLQQLLDIISEFILLGLNPEPVCVVLKKSPQLLKLPIMQMRKRSSYLRKLGLGEGKLKRVLYCCPEIFTMRQQDINDTVRLLKEKCLFTVQQVTRILHSCPSVLREDLGQLEYKFQQPRLTAVTAKKKTFVLQKKSSLVTPSTSPQLSQMAVAVLCQWKEFLLRGGAGELIYYCATASPAHSSYAKCPAQVYHFLSFISYFYCRFSTFRYTHTWHCVTTAYSIQ